VLKTAMQTLCNNEETAGAKAQVAVNQALSLGAFWIPVY
jgi:hypothetical protein